MSTKYCLGIEATAHTFGVGIVTFDGKVIANERDSYTTESGGIIPTLLSEHHVQCFDTVIQNALSKANLTFEDISLISFSQGPGIGHALRIGAFCARALSRLHSIPFVGVNHCIAHLEIGRILTKARDPVLLYASGANTQIIAYDGQKYRVFGETLDIGVGNFVDSFARHIGLGFPGGPKVSALREKGKNFIELPYTLKGMDVSYGGLLTNLKQKFDSGKYSKEDLCLSLEETAYAMLVEVSERALAHTGKKELLLGGGVACNKRLQEMCRQMCKDRGAHCFVLENQFNVDNGAMIAWNGVQVYNSAGELAISHSDINPYWRTDEVVVTWRD